MNIVLGVTGGIAAYKAAHIVRILKEAGHSVRVVPTESALRFVGAPTWEALSGQAVQTDVFTRVEDVEHVLIGQEADLVLIAPATADSLARIRAGIADDLLTATVLTTTAPVVVAPAMHTEMWFNPATVDNVIVLRSRGVHVLEPASGRLTGADSGPGRLPEPQEIVDFALSVHREAAAQSASGLLAGRRVFISAGGTREPLDPVRFLGNRSSGKQGAALAAAAHRAGAEVCLASANIDSSILASLPTGIDIREVETTAQLESVCREQAAQADIVIMAAAVADYRPAQTAGHKMKKDGDAGLTIELVQNPDILAGLVENRREGQTIVGFAAETGSPETSAAEMARQKIVRKRCDLLVFNDVSGGKTFGHDTTSVEVLALTDTGAVGLGDFTGDKADVSVSVMDTIAKHAVE
ncbi:bifunctional phosphopantothenoylcysteine decarboxylase/phosphopantothenate--cysteine ligase CoaBC [Brevibacterium sp. HMSC07C04]|uniref:bifunctional phosphopantothenoylcysteine decarboxylase/phosphopantothenate--cysteine ligase CoaBC n=1 Tax=Brevibacterium sp. HMSC07C04 TaxID=1581130 RepID=UPI0008A1B19A|nr:bifunctional phosphopantothenoylcysteine decarboxylase/phosphopantothenate--cysteine ligase CoaBC [Brevibacterium sp. HMSC07C04]OFS27159.1 phosphopantothenoylcysteine decarboxylase [Brevibacterium sp. HMSC07C04]